MNCRSCGAADLKPILSLGNMPLANGLLNKPTDYEDTYPLELVFCPECALVQITETVDPVKLFTDYKYYSSGSKTMLKSAADLVEQTIQRKLLGEDSLVIEIASNDGYLLKNYVAVDIPVFGIDPCMEIAKYAKRVNNVNTGMDYFSLAFAKSLNYKADVIHANNIMAHMGDLNDVAEGIAYLLKPDGIVIIETPYVKDMIDKVEFDTIYHEHLCYYSLMSLIHLFNRHGMSIMDVEHLDIHGGSLRVTAGKSPKIIRDSVSDLLATEMMTVDDYGYYEYFGRRVEVLKKDLFDTLYGLKLQGKRISGYAASAKGSILMNYCGIGEFLNYVVDNTPAKQGLYTPGTHLKIYPPEKLLEDQPDYALILAWNFADEIMSHEQEYIKRGGKFIIPVPKVSIL